MKTTPTSQGQSTPRRILIVKPSALGDVIQALPVASGLKKAYPDCELHWVINESFAPILESHPAIDRLILYPRHRWKIPGSLPEMWRWARQLREASYDITLDLQGLLRSGLMTWAAGSARRIGHVSAREGSRYFYNEVITEAPTAAAERYLAFLAHLGIEGQPHDFQLTSDASLPTDLASKKEYVVLHPYSTWRTKLWPWRNFQALADAMPEQQFVVVGRGDWFPLFGDNIIDLRQKTSLGELVTLLSAAKAVVSTDSGPAHIAGALGRPTLALFGATDWQKTQPVGRRVTVLRSGESCSPCLSRTCVNHSRMACMENIAVSTVVRVLRDNITQTAVA